MSASKCCSRCRRELPIDGFARKTKSPDGRQPWCRDCNAERSRRYHLEHKDEHLVAIQQRRQRNRRANQQRLYEYLRVRCCADCGQSDPVVLEFDHVRGVKKRSIGFLVQNSSWRMIEDEIAKCDVVCANCHRRRTYQRQGSHRSLWSK
jgi:hypothetical protein